MLRTLSIRDFVIVDRLALEFDAGFTALTGETGAGKSILLDALALLLGARGDAGMIRAGCARADLSAEFELPDTGGPTAWLAEQSLDDGGVLLLRRTIDDAGRSKAFINGVPATLAQLRELGEWLVDIHGQHAHQLLQKAGAQRELLDRDAGLADQAKQVGEAWQRLAAATAQLERAQHDRDALERERETVTWQLEEFDRLAPQSGEWAQVQADHARLAHAAALVDGAQGAVAVLLENDDALSSQLAGVIQTLRRLADYDPALADVAVQLEPAQLQLDDAAHTLSRYLQRLELDPQRLDEVEQRLQALHGAARKYRIDADALADFHQQLRERVAQLDAGADTAALSRAVAAAQADYDAAAGALTAARTQSAQRLGEQVTAAMQTLSMAGGRFDVQLKPLPGGSAHGNETIEFHVAAHPGVPLRPLAKVASGGELARISLALAVIASRAAAVPTLIFDEVDSGVGGAVAEVVGRLLRQLGAEHQVLCVTHLPQVAAQAHRQLRVTKTIEDGATRSQIVLLDDAQRVDEIARMLGGTEITATTHDHAREMLAQAARG